MMKSKSELSFRGEFFDVAYKKLHPHLSHKLSITFDGGDAAPDRIAIDCDTCSENSKGIQTLIEFLAEGMDEVKQ